MKVITEFFNFIPVIFLYTLFVFFNTEIHIKLRKWGSTEEEKDYHRKFMYIMSLFIMLGLCIKCLCERII